MDKIIIAIGTESEQKIGYVKEVIKELSISVKLIPTQVESKVSDQPIRRERLQQVQ